jgi:hypothetical protein
MKLHEFQEMVKAEREALRLTNIEKISKIVSVTNNERQTND